jgi:hypothetical protein
VSVGFLVGAVSAIAVALYRSNKFDQYVASASAVIVRGGSQDLKKPDEA